MLPSLEGALAVKADVLLFLKNAGVSMFLSKDKNMEERDCGKLYIFLYDWLL